ncbi:MAG: DUF4405 domain-containing protein [Candidatus Onthomonas sp.]
MKTKITARLVCDTLMTAALLLLMAYELIGRAAHEWIGAAMLLLCLCHHALNLPWTKNVFRGKYTAVRIVQTLIVLALLLCMAGLAYSGLILSRYVFSILPVSGSRSLARTLHLLCSYWGFVLMGLHLGFHWNGILGMASKMGRGKTSGWMKHLRWLAVTIAAYGVYAFWKRQTGSYLFLKTHFVFLDYSEPLIFFFIDYIAILGLFLFLDYSEPLIFFFIDYIAILGLFLFLGHYFAKALRHMGQKRKAV